MQFFFGLFITKPTKELWISPVDQMENQLSVYVERDTHTNAFLIKCIRNANLIRISGHRHNTSVLLSFYSKRGKAIYRILLLDGIEKWWFLPSKISKSHSISYFELSLIHFFLFFFLVFLPHFSANFIFSIPFFFGVVVIFPLTTMLPLL